MSMGSAMRLTSRCALGLGVVPLWLAFGAGAEPHQPGPGELALRTDRTSYEAQPTIEEPPYFYAFTLVAQLRNGTDRPIQVKRSCAEELMPHYEVRAVHDTLGSAYDPVWICAEIRPIPVIVLQPGERRLDTLHMSGPHMWDGRTKQPSGALAGRFRLVYEINACENSRACDVTSNEFEVRLGR
jgi:hypothetical protein